MIANSISHEGMIHMKPGKLAKKRADQVASNKKDKLNGSGDAIHHRIAETAYELYEQRGRADGYDLEDWLKAETLVSRDTM
jgi:hypothetical protein